jgi:small multidrug resistance pump
MNHVYLAVAIVAEVIATSSLKATESFSRLTPSVIVVVGFGTAFFLLSLALRTIPVGVAYAIWSGAGIVLIVGVGAVLFKQTPDLPAVLGIGLIVAGIAVLNLGSNMAAH